MVKNHKKEIFGALALYGPRSELWSLYRWLAPSVVQPQGGLNKESHKNKIRYYCAAGSLVLLLCLSGVVWSGGGLVW